MKSRAGRERWCEVSTAPARAARTFLQLYPDTQVICLHRGCSGFVRAATADAARRPGDTVFGAFAAAHPGDPLAAAAAYWCDRTEQLLALERDKPGLCRRVRCEDLAASPAEADRVLGFLGLRQPVPRFGRAARVGAAHAGLAYASAAHDAAPYAEFRPAVPRTLAPHPPNVRPVVPRTLAPHPPNVRPVVPREAHLRASIPGLGPILAGRPRTRVPPGGDGHLAGRSGGDQPPIAGALARAGQPPARRTGLPCSLSRDRRVIVGRLWVT